MATAFTRTMSALQAAGFRRYAAALLAGGGLLAGWSAWFWLSRNPRYEVTETARIEADQASHLVQARVAGQVVSSRLELGRRVAAGDVLVELDSNPERLRLEEESSRLRIIEPELRALEAEIRASEQAGQREREATGVAVEEARARLEEAEALARVAAFEADRLRRLYDSGLIPERDLTQGKAEAERRRAAAESLRLAVQRGDREQQTRDSDREAHRNRILAEIRRLEGQRTTSRAAIDRLKYEIERRRIRSPVDGRLGEVAVLRAGAVVEEGEKLAAVVPEGKLRIIAQFPPPAALGRIRPGQPARLRLHGFPWAQYGSIRATVSSVGSEIRDGRVRVELAPAGGASAIPVQHGLPGTAEVQVEEISPATLVLRVAGGWVAAPTSPFPSGTQATSP